MIKFNKDKDWLVEEYINKNRKREDIALECHLFKIHGYNHK